MLCSLPTIAHLSDLHCGDPHFVPDLMERAIAEINDLKPEIVVCSGDLTTFGFKEEFAQAKRYLDTVECEALVVVPGPRAVWIGTGSSVVSIGRTRVHLSGAT